MTAPKKHLDEQTYNEVWLEYRDRVLDLVPSNALQCTVDRLGDLCVEAWMAGKENAREEWRQDLYFRLIDARYRRGPLVITTNLRPAEELPGHIGEAAYSRLWEMASTRWWVDMCGPDWRARIAQESE